MHQQSLNGIWQRRIGQGPWMEQIVPYSTIPVGHSECRRTFDGNPAYARAFLRFSGITYAARVFLNGVHLGDMLPYCEYTYDISAMIQPTDNELLVALEDISPVFGPSEGWENYGGIIHDVDILFAQEEYLKDVFFTQELSPDFRDGQIKVHIQAQAAPGATALVTLKKDGQEILHYDQAPNGEPEIKTIHDVALWSPESPALYTLRVSLQRDQQELDAYECQVGFRCFRHDGRHFLLNGQDYFLLGVCKHEMVGESGHTPTREQVEKDLKMIKDMGCNYVRLVHYPHDSYVLDLADRIGLMVSEEPGLWWSDTANPEIRNGSLEVLRRTILRDRNHPSIAFWLCFNECHFTEEFLMASAQVCRENDPTRMVSGANCMDEDDTIKYYHRCKFDFYTMHPYSQTFARAANAAKKLQDMPLLFTEWGGWPVYDNPQLITEFIHNMIDLYRNPGENGTLAGACFWYWAELYEFNRGTPACREGILREGLVDIHRKPRAIYQPFCDAWAELKKTHRPEDLYEYRALESIEKSPLSTPDAGGDWESAMALAKAPIERYHHFPKRNRQIKIGPLLQKAEGGLSPRPLILSDGQTLHFPCNGQAQMLTIIGAVSLPKGYPLSGEYGEDAAEVHVEYADGTAAAIPLKNGVHITTIMSTYGPSRINPQADLARRFAEFSYDKNHENYVINRLDLPLKGAGALKEITLTSCNRGYAILIYGLYLDA